MDAAKQATECDEEAVESAEEATKSAEGRVRRNWGVLFGRMG